MPFTSSDLFSASAGTEISNYFNPFVTKFDSQSFYNFEQDNQPLFDLEERTTGLWEKATGYFTSALNGLPLVVSGSTDPDNRNIFTSLQEAVDALPNVIRTPVLIEVAASGYLGPLNLKNIKIVEDGVLEIINRGFAKIYSGEQGSLTTSSFGKSSEGDLQSRTYISSVSSADLSSTISATSALSVATNVSALFEAEFNRTLLQQINFTTDRGRNGRLAFGFIDPGTSVPSFLNSTTENVFTIAGYENAAFGITGNISDQTVATLDVSATRGDTGADINRPATNNVYIGREVAGLSYCNALSSINIENCDGPLYVRGFCVDGVSGATTAYINSPLKSPIGITVVNSNPVIENCSVVRSTTTGAKFINSDVTLSRGFVSDRNYEVITPGTARASQSTIGLHAINSSVTLATDATYALGSDYLFNIQNHNFGIVLENSTLTGGNSRSGSNKNDSPIAFSYNNTGIKALNSTINVSGNLDVYNNYTGIHLTNSYLSTDRITVENHTLNGIVSENSLIQYNNSLIRRDYSPDSNGFRMTQSLFHRNGSHLDLNKGSKFSYYHDLSTVNIPAKFGALRFVDSHGVEQGSLPAIKLTQSEADLLHARISVSSIDKTAPGIKGSALKATDSSLVRFLGTVNGATVVEGPPAFGNAKRVAGIAAQDGSKVCFRGPTAVVQFGTCVLAENNSTVEFTPHRKDDETVDVSGFSLSVKGNHTSVELHSAGKTCLAAVNNSQIVMEDLGSAEALVPLVDTDYPNTSINVYVSAGSMQFYPNSNLATYVTEQEDLDLTDAGVTSEQMTAAVYGDASYNYLITNPFATDASALIRDYISGGGLCVQAFGNSVVKANNIHFLTGYVQADGTYLDSSAVPAGNNQLKIWNIGDDSKLYASHLAVSGGAPSSTPYNGPRATFLSAVPNETGLESITNDSSSVAYAAPSGTPNTGTLSVCDLFGLGVDLSAGIIDTQTSGINFVITGDKSQIGQLTSQNKGPFRLFFSTNSAMRFLGYASGLDFGPQDTRPLQHLAQGYSLSGNVGVPSSIVDSSSLHTVLLQVGDGGVAHASGYYYGSAMLNSDRGTHAYLDESAANMFANAKNCATRVQFGRANPKVTIYKSTTDAGGEGSPGVADQNEGAGLRSINIFDIRRDI